MKNRIGELMKEMGVKQEELAILCNVGQTTISAWVTGRANPNMECISIMCHRFDVNMEYLMGVEDNIKNRISFAERLARGELVSLTESQKMMVVDYIRFLKWNKGGKQPTNEPDIPNT